MDSWPERYQFHRHDVADPSSYFCYGFEDLFSRQRMRNYNSLQRMMLQLMRRQLLLAVAGYFQSIGEGFVVADLSKAPNLNRIPGHRRLWELFGVEDRLVC
jgi:hypothetical protein